VFLGVNTLNLDTKGRLAIPVKYRERLMDNGASAIVVTINPQERCLWLYPEAEWQPIAQKVSRLPPLKRQNRQLQRLLLGHASELEMDGQGRVLLNNELREYASMDKRVALVGQGHKFELWSEERWTDSREDWLQEANQPESDLSDELQNLAL
jgi:MraZ protein